MRQTRPAPPGLAAVFGPADDLHMGVTRLDRLQHRAALVGRGIVDDDTFDIWIGLTEYGIDRGAQKAPVIEIDDDDTDQRQAKKLLSSPNSVPEKLLTLRAARSCLSARKPLRPFPDPIEWLRHADRGQCEPVGQQSTDICQARYRFGKGTGMEPCRSGISSRSEKRFQF